MFDLQSPDQINSKKEKDEMNDEDDEENY